jgi:uncharacterized membrane protein
MRTRQALPAAGRVTGVTLPAILLGVDLGGLINIKKKNQILQWHHMLTSTGDYPATTVAGLEVNSLWDGMFHLTTYVFVAVGVFMLWDRARHGGVVWSWKSILGWSLMGWGLFNVVEGIVDHHVLQIHHVRSGPDQLVWDLAFLAVGLILVLAGRGCRVLTDRQASSPTVIEAR